MIISTRLNADLDRLDFIWMFSSLSEHGGLSKGRFALCIDFIVGGLC
jgi:hypothetical protein